MAEIPKQQQPTDEMIRSAIVELLPTVELATTGVKKFRKLLQRRFDGVDLSARTSFIKEALTEAINNMDEEEEAESEAENEAESEAESEDDDSDIPSRTKPRKTNTGGYNAPKKISDKLSAFLGGVTEISRPQIVKQLWVYIKEHDLQNPANRKEILLDGKLKDVFGCDKFTMFSMNKYISSHCHPFPPVDLTSPPKKAKSKTKAQAVTPSPSGKRSARNHAGSNKRARTVVKRKAGTQPPYRLSDALVAVLNKDILPRPQVVSGLWEYIKGNGLQNPKDKREILCDDKLSRIFGGKQKVTMFSMNKYITPHLIEKVEKSEYQHSGDEAGNISDNE